MSCARRHDSRLNCDFAGSNISWLQPQTMVDNANSRTPTDHVHLPAHSWPRATRWYLRTIGVTIFFIHIIVSFSEVIWIDLPGYRMGRNYLWGPDDINIRAYPSVWAKQSKAKRYDNNGRWIYTYRCVCSTYLVSGICKLCSFIIMIPLHFSLFHYWWTETVDLQRPFCC